MSEKQYDNTNTGVLFKNEKKTNDMQPHYKGSGDRKGEDKFWMSAWLKKTKDGRTYMSFAFTDKEESVAPAPSNNDDGTDNVPF